MKKLMLGLLSLFLVLNLAQAQDGDKAVKDAGKALSAYNLDQANNKGKLQEAVTAIQMAEKDAAAAQDPKTWLTKGEIYGTLASQIVTTRELGLGSLEELPQVELPAVQAADAYLQALKLAQKKYDQKTAAKGLATVQGNLSNMGVYALREQDYATAYQNFAKGVAVHEALKQAGEESVLNDQKAFNDNLYYAGLSAVLGGNMAEAKPLIQQLIDANYEDAGIYDAMYKITAEEGDLNAAYVYLQKGREKFPDDTQLLFSEINHFLRQGKLDELIGKLETAMQKEPDNVSLFATMGNVYDNLYQTSAKEGNAAKAQEYFDKAKSYYEQALQKKPDYHDAVYSLGALYYNRAASMTQEMSELANDFSKEGQKKYDALKLQVEKEFDAALPYFQQAEQMDPNDLNTLIALKEIFARKNDFEKSTEFKNRLEKVQGGGTNESFFKNN